MAEMSETAYESRRRAALAKARSEAGIDALLVSRGADIGYLIGFSGADSLLLVGKGLACLVTDGRFAEQAARECPNLEIVVRTGPMPPAVADVVRRHKVRRLGVQGGHMTISGRASLAAALRRCRLVPLGEVVLDLRAVKDAHEVRAIQRAIRIAEKAFRGLIAGGAKAILSRTEREIAAELDYRMVLGGADSPAFDTIVAAGAHSSLPHHRPGHAKVRPGQAVLFDWGAWAGGYSSDLTRAVFTGRIPPKLTEIHEVVRSAQAAGIAAVRAGTWAKTVDQAARAVIEKAGFGERFTHSLGHGIGRGRGNGEVHELPSIARQAKGRLRAGMVVTIEPGVYLPGVGGIRIEDDVLVTAHGAVKLSSLPTAASAMVLR
jgi:Xaa-Pro aminopeptidase